MAGKSAVLSVRIIADATKAAAGFKQASGDVEQFQKSTEARLATFGGHVDRAAAVAGAAAAAYGAFAKQALDSASAFQQSSGAVESVFKDQAESIKALAADAAQSVGLSASAYQDMSAIMGSQLKNMGVAQGEVVGQTESLIGLGADLASMFGGTTADAVGALSSLLRGERDPIERYGVSIKQADINARLASQGLSDLEGEALRQAETQATLALLFEQTADAQGNFARETDTAAGATQIAAAQWENAKATLGEQLLPIAVQAAEWLGKIAEAVGEHPELFMQAGLAIGGVATALMAISGTVKVIQAASTAFGIFNAVVAANPIGLAVVALAALAAGLVYAYQNCETFRAAVDFMGRSAGAVLDWLGEGVKAFGKLFTNPTEAVQDFARLAEQALGKVAEWLAVAREWLDKVAASGDGVGSTIAGALSTAIGWIEKFIGWVRTAWEWVGNLANAWSSSGVSGGGSRSFGVNAAAGGPDLTMDLARAEILRFAAVPDLLASPSGPDLTAARLDAVATRSSRAMAPAAPTVVNNFHIDGAIDPDATARQIKRILDRYDLRQGY